MKKRILKMLLVMALSAFVLSACGTEGNDSNKAETTTQTSDQTSDENTVSSNSTTYGANFVIENLDDGIKKVTDGDGRELVLVPKELEEVPEEYADATVIRTPVENAVFLSSTQVCTFRAVDDETILDSIGGVSGTAEDWSDISGISELITSGDIINIGGDGMGEPDYELIQSLEPDVVFTYGGTSGQYDEMAKFDELGINYAVDNEYEEDDYMARMEWMRFILTFFNADDEANSVLAQASDNIEAIKTEIADQEQPKVAVFSVYDGTVYPTLDSSWSGSMLADMGGTNVFSGLTESTLTMEAAYELIQEADIIVYTSTPTYCDGISGIEEAFPEISECAAYKNNRVYQYSDGFWHGIDQTDVVAGDLASIIYPDIFSDRTMTYYQKAEVE